MSAGVVDRGVGLLALYLGLGLLAPTLWGLVLFPAAVLLVLGARECSRTSYEMRPVAAGSYDVPRVQVRTDLGTTALIAADPAAWPRRPR
jgi:hypothetical protein